VLELKFNRKQHNNYHRIFNPYNERKGHQAATKSKVISAFDAKSQCREEQGIPGAITNLTEKRHNQTGSLLWRFNIENNNRNEVTIPLQYTRSLDQTSDIHQESCRNIDS